MHLHHNLKITVSNSDSVLLVFVFVFNHRTSFSGQFRFSLCVSVVYFYVHQVKSSVMFLPLRVPYVEKSVHYEHISCIVELPI